MLRTVLDTIPVRVFWKDRDSVYVGGNRALAQDCGYDNPEALVGKTDFDTVSVATAELYRADDRRVMETGEAKLNFEEPQRRRDGSVGWLRTNKVPLRDQQGRVIGVLGTYEDITERKQAEEALAQERELLATVINLLPDSVYVKDRDSRFLLANQVVATRLGKARPTDVLGLTDGDFYPVATAAGYRADEEQVLAGAAIREKEEHVVYPQGQVLTVLTTKVPLRNRQGDVVGLVGVGRDITERKRAEEALRQSEEKFRSLVETTSDFIWEADAAGRYTYASPQVKTLLGFAPEEVLGKTPFDFMPPEEAAKVAATFQALAAAKAPLVNLENVNRHRDGRQVILETSGTPILNAAGELCGYRGVDRDVTERRQAEDQLRVLAEMLDITPVAIMIHSFDGQIHYANRHAPELHGYTVEEFLRLNLRELDVPESAALIEQRMNLLREKGEASFEVGHYRKDRSVIPVMISTRHTVWRGQPVILSVGMDITERKRAELILQESEQKFRALFENMAEGVALHEIVCNAQGEPVDYRLLDVNPAYGRQTGLLPEQARGRRASELYGISEPPYLKEWTEVARTGKPRTFEAFFAPLGRHFHISTVSPKPGVFATVFEDITERKRNEEELRRKNEELERFTYTVSHDLKSPLITIKGFAGALLQDAEAGRFDRVQGDLKRIAGATDKMAELLNDLLELSRIGRIMNPPSEVNLEHLVREVVELLAGPVSQGQVEIAVHPGLPVVVGDRQRLREVFQNLIENAIRFMGGQPRPRVEVGQRLDGAERVFFVRDNGAGIEPRYQETVFGLFNKLDAKTPGTGIGLALVRRIVEVHGGRIWVESEGRKRGATFCFTLPLTTPKRKESQP